MATRDRPPTSSSASLGPPPRTARRIWRGCATTWSTTRGGGPARSGRRSTTRGTCCPADVTPTSSTSLAAPTALTVLGVRHHSPACARLVRGAIERLRPPYVLGQGP